MKFEISRTTDIYGDNKPVEGSFKSQCGDWLIEIKTLDDLIDFVKDNGCIVVSDYSNIDENSIPEIEIYDDYRE